MSRLSVRNFTVKAVAMIPPTEPCRPIFLERGMRIRNIHRDVYFF